MQVLYTWHALPCARQSSDFASRRIADAKGPLRPYNPNYIGGNCCAFCGAFSASLQLCIETELETSQYDVNTIMPVLR